MIFFLYFQIILSFSLSFLFHVFNFKKHFHSFFTTNNNNYKCPNPNPPVSSKSKLLISLPPRPTMIHDMEQLMACTESIGFESIDEMKMQLVVDGNNEGDDDEYCWKNTSIVEEEREEGVNGGVNGNMFPPPLSSLGGNGLPSYILLPVRMNGRLQLNKMKVKRPKTVYADREDGRLRLFLVTDQCYIDDNDDADDDMEQEDEETCDIYDDVEQEEEEMCDIDDDVEQEEEEMVEESRYEYEEDDRVREWNNNENYRKRYNCHHQQLVNHIHGSHGNLLMYGVSIV